MDCCCILNRAFDKGRAKRDLRRYSKKGLNREAKLLADFLKDRIMGLEVLDVGCGIGDLTMELVKAGAANSVGVDVSEAYIETAKELRAKLGLEQSVEFEVMDFAENEGKIKKMDVVVSNRVICCYPDMQRFIQATAPHAKKFYGITYPVDHYVMRFFTRILNWMNQFTRRRGFRVYIHSQVEMRKHIETQGLRRIFNARKGLWVMDVFER